MDSENPASESEKAEQFLPDTSSQENDLFLTLTEKKDIVDRYLEFFKKCLKNKNPANTEENTFKIDLNLTKYWNNLSLNTKTFDKVACLSTVLYTVDLGSDGALSYYFLHGAVYTKTVANVTDKAITDFNCTQIAQTYHNLTDQTTYTFDCYEQDPIWGALTLGINLLTGFGMFGSLEVLFGRKSWRFKKISNFFQRTAFFLFWPFYVLFIKSASIFVSGQEDWKSANMRLTALEGVFEAQAQFLLQLYIVFNRPDRVVNLLQRLSLVSSLMSIVWAKIENHFTEKPLTSLKTKALHFPLYLAFSILTLGSWALMVATMRIFFSFYFFIHILVLFSTKTCNSWIKTKSGKFLMLTIPMILNVFTLIVVAVMVNCFSSTMQIMTYDGYLDILFYISLANVDIVKRLSFFNTIFAVCLTCFAIYLPLAYFQSPEMKELEEEAKKTIQETEHDADNNENESSF